MRTEPEPKFMPPGTLATPGMPCTKVTGSDSYAATVTAVSSSGRRITVAEKTGRPYQATLRKDGYYHRVGDPAQAWNTIMLGLAEDHRDPHR